MGFGLHVSPGDAPSDSTSDSHFRFRIFSNSAPVRASTEAGLARDQVHNCLWPEDIQHMINTAVQQSLSSRFLPPSREMSVRSFASFSPERDRNADSLSITGSESPTPSYVSRPSVLAEADPQEPDLSEDEGLPPEQPSFMGLFPQVLFKSLLFKAVNTAQLGSSTPEPAPTPAPGSLNPLFAEPSRSVTSIPMPPLFLKVIKKQWAWPGAAPVSSSMDRNNFNVAIDLADLLQVPAVDAPIVALLPNASVPGDLDEGLRPDEHRSDQVL